MPRMHAGLYLLVYKALSEAEKYNKVTSLTVADVCMFSFEIEVSQTQSRNKSQNHIHYLHQAPVVRKLDSAIHRINRYPEDKYYDIQLRSDPVDSNLSSG